MLDKRLKEHMLHYYDAAVSEMIAKDNNISQMDGLRMFLDSQTYEMLCDVDLEMWEFSASAMYEIWKTEKETGDPRNSSYLRGE